ncbi:hypothetical protein, partial [Shinella sp.]|uniref:hypothetical protein n=1 Tax=Shinella sp. TaxID=1870904 RepID=UPI003F6F828A
QRANLAISSFGLNPSLPSLPLNAGSTEQSPHRLRARSSVICLGPVHRFTVSTPERGAHESSCSAPLAPGRKVRFGRQYQMTIFRVI